MMANALGVYWSVHHRRPTDYEYFMQLNPAAVKLMDAGQPDYQWVQANLPGCLLLARDHAMSEQKSDMLADPEGTGKRHAQEWKNHQQRLGFDPGRTLVLGINEPAVWEPGVPEALRVYTIAFLDACRGLGLRAGAMQLSVGWPGNHGPDTPPDWAPWHGVEDAIKRGNHALVLHEYWATDGPAAGWGWTTGRFTQCPWDVPIIIGECGLDMGVVQDPATLPGKRGWQGNVDATHYAAQCAEYVRLCQQDARYFSATAFTTDYQSEEWGSFDTEPARHELVNACAGLSPAEWYHGEVTPEPPEPEPMPGALIWPVNGPVTQRWGENPEYYQQALGIPYHNGTDVGAPEGSPVVAAADGVVGMVDYDEGGYGWYCRLFCPGQRVHVFVAHMSEVIARVGQRVMQGELLGYSGNTGMSTGPHAHVECREGTETDYALGTFGHSKGRVDPQAFFWAAGAAQEPPSSAATDYFLPFVSG